MVIPWLRSLSHLRLSAGFSTWRPFGPVAVASQGLSLHHS